MGSFVDEVGFFVESYSVSSNILMLPLDLKIMLLVHRITYMMCTMQNVNNITKFVELVKNYFIMLKSNRFKIAKNAKHESSVVFIFEGVP